MTNSRRLIASPRGQDIVQGQTTTLKGVGRVRQPMPALGHEHMCGAIGPCPLWAKSGHEPLLCHTDTLEILLINGFLNNTGSFGFADKVRESFLGGF